MTTDAPATKAKLPMLRPHHFVRYGSSTRLSNAGLLFDEIIDSCERRSEIFGEIHLEDLLDGPPTRIVLNPPQPSAKNLRAQLKRGQAKIIPGEKFDVGYELPDAYDRSWVRSGSGDEDIEGQDHVALVVFSDDIAVGYTGLTVHIVHPDQDDPTDKDILLSFSLHLIYVHPLYRGKGFGMDLSVGCAFLCRDILGALYEAVPANTHISTYVNADLDSPGGERFVEQVYSSLQDQADLLHKRRSVSIKVILDAAP